MTGFNDLLDANAHYAASFTGRPLTGKAQAGVLVLTCMDSRIDPLAILGLRVGDAKILRTPGAHVTPDALAGCVLGVHLLGVDRSSSSPTRGAPWHRPTTPPCANASPAPAAWMPQVSASVPTSTDWDGWVPTSASSQPTRSSDRSPKSEVSTTTSTPDG